jgi:hypothetical protein
MTAVKLPHINYHAPLATDDLDFQQTSNDEEIQTRTKLVMASDFGIEDSVDPRNITTTTLNRSLNVRPSSEALKVTVDPGTAVTENGNWVTLDSNIALLALTSTVAGAVNVVFIEYYLEAGTDRRVNKYNNDVAVRQQRPADNEDVIKVDTLTNFENTALYSPDRRKDIVVLAIVTVNQLADLTLDLTIDLGGNNFTYNRLWYSPTDIVHRNKTGTATATDTNPHGTSLNDLAAGTLTLYQQTVEHGIVLSKDSDVPRYPGIKTTETILAASFSTDTTGLVTRRSTQYGGVGAKYANLAHFPLYLGSVYETGTPALQISADFVPDENILVIPVNEPIPAAGVTIEYLYAQAGEGPVDPATNDLVFLQPAASELIIADGIAVSSIPTPLLSFDGSGPIPRDFRVYLDSDGALVSSPQILLPAIKLDAIGLNTALAITRSMRGAAPIEIGMTRAADVTGMSVTILCTGTSTSGTPLTESVTFSYGSYTDSAVPATSEELEQFVRTSATFSTLTQIEVTSRANDGNDSQIIVYGVQESAYTDTYKEKCPLADIFWDGLGVDTVTDARPVSANLELPRTPIYNGTGAMPTGARAWLYEDFRKPRYGDSFAGDEAATAAVGSLSIVSNALLVAGDTIDLGNSKVLTAKTPVAAAGSVTALDIGINVPLASRTFSVDETPAGGGTINASVDSSANALEDLASDLASRLTTASAAANGGIPRITYTGNVTTLRQIELSGTSLFNIVSSPLATLLNFSVASGSNAYASGGTSGLGDGDLFTLSDGTLAKTFEFDVSGSGLANASHIAVNVLPADLAASVKTAIINAITASSLAITATSGSGNTVALVNDVSGVAGNVTIQETISTGYSMSPVGMTGGSAGGANTALGEFNVGTTAADTAANIITTLADPTFASLITGTAATVGGYDGVTLTRDVTGLSNNTITGTFVNPAPIVLDGFERGTDRYVGITPDAFSEGLNSNIPPAATDLDTVRRKYRSRSLGVPSGLQGVDVSEISVVLHNPENVSSRSVRVKPAFKADAGNWRSYQFMTQTELNPNYAVFTTDFGAAIDKIQLEMYGIFTDFALSDITNVSVVGQGPTGATGTAGAAGATGATGTGAAGATGATGPAATAYTQTFTSSTVWVVTHNMATANVTWAAWDTSEEAIIPATVDITDTNTVTMTFAVAVAGRAVIMGVS